MRIRFWRFKIKSISFMSHESCAIRRHQTKYLIVIIVFPDLGSYHLPFLYSCVSFLGVLLLLGKHFDISRQTIHWTMNNGVICSSWMCKMFCVLYFEFWFLNLCFIYFFLVCTPLGFIRLFGVVGQVLVKPHLMRDVNEEYHASYLEEASVLRKIENLQYNQTIFPKLSTNFTSSLQPSKYCDINTIPKAFGSLTHTFLRNRSQKLLTNNICLNHKNHLNSAITDGTISKDATIICNDLECDDLHERLRQIKAERKELDKLRSSTAIQRNLVYPLAMLMLLFLTGLTVLIVVQNTLELLIGIKALPLSTRVNVFHVSFCLVVRWSHHIRSLLIKLFN